MDRWGTRRQASRPRFSRRPCSPIPAPSSGQRTDRDSMSRRVCPSPTCWPAFHSQKHPRSTRRRRRAFHAQRISGRTPIIAEPVNSVPLASWQAARASAQRLRPAQYRARYVGSSFEKVRAGTSSERRSAIAGTPRMSFETAARTLSNVAFLSPSGIALSLFISTTGRLERRATTPRRSRQRRAPF